MASVVSYEYLNAQKGAVSGLASLGTDSKIPVAQLPSVAISNFKGTAATSSALPTTGTTGDYAYVTGTTSYWYWNYALATPAWVNQQISSTDYNALSTTAQTAVPYIIVS